MDKVALFRTCKTIALLLQADPICWFEIKCNVLYRGTSFRTDPYARDLARIVEYCRAQTLRTQSPPEGKLVTMLLTHYFPKDPSERMVIEPYESIKTATQKALRMSVNIGSSEAFCWVARRHNLSLKEMFARDDDYISPIIEIIERNMVDVVAWAFRERAEQIRDADLDDTTWPRPGDQIFVDHLSNFRNWKYMKKDPIAIVELIDEELPKLRPELEGKVMQLCDLRSRIKINYPSVIDAAILLGAHQCLRWFMEHREIKPPHIVRSLDFAMRCGLKGVTDNRACEHWPGYERVLETMRLLRDKIDFRDEIAEYFRGEPYGPEYREKTSKILEELGIELIDSPRSNLSAWDDCSIN